MPRTLDGYGYIYNRNTGKLVSQGTVITDPLPFNLLLRERASKHDAAMERWDEGVKDIVPFRNTDRIAALTAERDATSAEIARLEGVQPA